MLAARLAGPAPGMRFARLRHALTCITSELRLRLQDFGAPAARLVLIVSPQRSGSTWLYDALRCHPAIEPQARYAVFAALVGIGRRYPSDLSVDDDALRIEVAPGEWAGLPRLVVKDGKPDGTAGSLPAVSIEKIHPHFFYCATDRFLRRLARLEATSRVLLVYLVRDPEAALASFLRYQARDPHWYPQVRPGSAGAFLRRDLTSLLALARVRPGVIVDYDELRLAFGPTIGRIFAALGPEFALDPARLEDIERRTARDARPAQATAFLGYGAGTAKESAEWSAADQRALAECRQIYAEIVRLRGTEPPR